MRHAANAPAGALESNAPAWAQVVRAVREPAAVVGRRMRRDIGPTMQRSLSLFIPGAGQLAAGRVTAGLFFATWIAFLVVGSRAIVHTMDRLATTLPLLGGSSTSACWALVAAFVGIVGLHVAGALDAPERWDAARTHPIVCGCASALLPGWGQLLNGDRVRSALALCGAWLSVAAHVGASGATMTLLERYAPAVGPLEGWLRQPAVSWALLWTMPVAVWLLAAYDAWASAHLQRRLATEAASRQPLVR